MSALENIDRLLRVELGPSTIRPNAARSGLSRRPPNEPRAKRSADSPLPEGHTRLRKRRAARRMRFLRVNAGSSAMSSKVPPHSRLPTGTVTFLFTDIEGSTTLWEQFPDAMQDALARHDKLLRHAIESSSGCIVKGTGDGVYAVFAAAADALAACLAAQRALQAGEDGASNPEPA